MWYLKQGLMRPYGFCFVFWISYFLVSVTREVWPPCGDCAGRKLRHMEKPHEASGQQAWPLSQRSPGSRCLRGRVSSWLQTPAMESAWLLRLPFWGPDMRSDTIPPCYILSEFFMCMCMYVHVHTCMEARDQSQVSILMLHPSCFFETGTLTGPELIKQASLAGQFPRNPPVSASPDHF